MTRAPSRPFLLIVVEPANDRGRMAWPIGFWPIRWLRSGGIGRLRPLSPTHCTLRAERADPASLGSAAGGSADDGGRRG